MVITSVVECFDFFQSQVDENHIALPPKDRWSVFRQDGFRKSYPMFAIKKMQFYPVLSIDTVELVTVLIIEALWEQLAIMKWENTFLLNMAKKHMKTIGYLRVSTAGQDLEKNKADILHLLGGKDTGRSKGRTIQSHLERSKA